MAIAEIYSRYAKKSFRFPSIKVILPGGCQGYYSCSYPIATGFTVNANSRMSYL